MHGDSFFARVHPRRKFRKLISSCRQSHSK